MSEDFFIVQSATTIKITNKVHLHSQKRKCDTLCSKKFAFPNVGTLPINLNDDKVIVLNGEIVEDEFMCKKCINIYKKIINRRQ